tara:strand:- start:26 stop:349 length:324 start_codon:yes stop_codon:yes gene_type:complete
MASTIKHIRSAVAGRTPTTSQLELGELAINTTDGKVFIKKSVSGTESIVEISGGGGGSSQGVILESQQTISSNVTLTSGYNGVSAGPVEIANGVTVEVPNNATWAIV